MLNIFLSHPPLFFGQILHSAKLVPAAISHVHERLKNYKNMHLVLRDDKEIFARTKVLTKKLNPQIITETPSNTSTPEFHTLNSLKTAYTETHELRRLQRRRPRRDDRCKGS